MKFLSTILVLISAYDLINGTPTRDCACLPANLCSTGNTVNNDGSCPEHLTLCCRENLPSPPSPLIMISPGRSGRALSPSDLSPVNSTCPCVPYHLCGLSPCLDGCDVIFKRNVKNDDDSCETPNVRCCEGGSNTTEKISLTP